MDLFQEIFNETRVYFNETCQMCCDKTMTQFFKDLLHYRASSVGLWCTDKPEIIPENIRHLFFELKK